MLDRLMDIYISCSPYFITPFAFLYYYVTTKEVYITTQPIPYYIYHVCITNLLFTHIPTR
jgi:hypothetical protein